MHFVYIIYSPSLNRYYVGESGNVEKRLDWHNSHVFEKASTSISADWQIEKFFSVDTRSEARIVERYIKSMKSSRFLQNLCNDPVYFANFKMKVSEKFHIAIH